MRVIVSSAGLIFALVFSFIVMHAVKAQQPTEIEADDGHITMVGTVEAIDATRQIVTLVGPHNNWVEVKVGPEHLKLIKVKEKITISYQDEVAVALRKVNKGEQGDDIEAEETADMGLDNPTAAEQDWVELTPHGAANLTTVEITDTIAAINRNKRIITFAGTGGKTRTIRVGPNVSLEQVDPGDEVVLEITRAVAVDIRPV